MWERVFVSARQRQWKREREYIHSGLRGSRVDPCLKTNKQKNCRSTYLDDPVGDKTWLSVLVCGPMCKKTWWSVSRVSFQWRKCHGRHIGCFRTFCLLVAHCMQLVPFLFCHPTPQTTESTTLHWYCKSRSDITSFLLHFLLKKYVFCNLWYFFDSIASIKFISIKHFERQTDREKDGHTPSFSHAYTERVQPHHTHVHKHARARPRRGASGHETHRPRPPRDVPRLPLARRRPGGAQQTQTGMCVRGLSVCSGRTLRRASPGNKNAEQRSLIRPAGRFLWDWEIISFNSRRE